MDKTKQPQPVRAQVERRSVSMYPRDWEVVTRVAQRVDGNESSALRMIVREWDSGNGGGDGSGSEKRE